MPKFDVGQEVEVNLLCNWGRHGFSITVPGTVTGVIKAPDEYSSHEYWVLVKLPEEEVVKEKVEEHLLS